MFHTSFQVAFWECFWVLLMSVPLAKTFSWRSKRSTTSIGYALVSFEMHFFLSLHENEHSYHCLDIWQRTYLNPLSTNHSCCRFSRLLVGTVNYNFTSYIISLNRIKLPSCCLFLWWRNVVAATWSIFDVDPIRSVMLIFMLISLNINM